MSYSTRVFVVAVVLVLLAMASFGSAFDMESLLRTAEQRTAFRAVQRMALEEADADADTCNKIVCDITPGTDNCSIAENNTIHLCTGFNFCNSSQMCEAKYPIGHECSNSDECQSSWIHNTECVHNMTTDTSNCTYSKVPFWPGDACTDNEDCFSKSCVNGTCEGNAEEDECWGHIGACAKGLYCNGTVCLNATADNGTCTNSNECALEWTGRQCLSGRCVAPFTGEEGASCDIHATLFGKCAGGLYCDPYSSTCKKYQYIECEIGNDTQCDALPQTTCKCSSLSGKGFCSNDQTTARLSADGVKYYKAAAQCARDNGCALNPDHQCFVQHCMADIDCYASELFKVYEVDIDCLGFKFECNPENPSDSNPSDDASAVSTTAAVVISALAAVAALL